MASIFDSYTRSLFSSFDTRFRKTRVITIERHTKQNVMVKIIFHQRYAVRRMTNGNKVVTLIANLKLK